MPIQQHEDTWNIHLIILAMHTLFTTILIAESTLLGWEKWPLVLLTFGAILCWGIHISQNVPPELSIWFYLAMQMSTFFFFGIHPDAFYALAPITLLVMMAYQLMGQMKYIYVLVFFFSFTMLFSMFVEHSIPKYTTVTVTLIILNFLMVYGGAYLCRNSIILRELYRKATSEKISELADMNRRTEDFLTNVSHELRTPINAVTGITTVLLKSDIDTRTKIGLQSIQAAGHRLFEQIGDILDHTEVHTHQITIVEDNYAISSMLNDVITEIDLSGNEYTCDLLFDVDANIPSVLIGDGRKIKKILRHIIDNALKFTKTGGVKVRLEAINKTYGVNLLISVSDTGIGVKDEDVERITERFYQSDSSRSRGTGGLGLGLSIVQGLTEAMHGFMRIDNTAEIGTTFIVSIPQKVYDATPCIAVQDQSQLNIGCYLKPGHYEVPLVWDYYNEAISHLVTGFKVTLHRAGSINDIEKFQNKKPLTHLFLGWNEYTENSGFFDNLSEEICVVLIAAKGLAPSSNSNIKLVRKPLNPFRIAELLVPGEVVKGDLEDSEYHRLICPGARVLVVDDEVMNLVVAKGIFKDYQIVTETVESGAAAIDICRDNEFDIIFMDHMMPEMDGVETMKRLRELNPEKEMSIVALTANAVSGAREMFLEEGFDDFISKPIETAELERVFKKNLPSSLIRYQEIKKVYKTSPLAAISVDTDSADERIKALGLAGINTAIGLSNCNNDSSLYIQVIGEFISESNDLYERINRFFKRTHKHDFRATAHSISDIANLIGAVKLSDVALDAERNQSQNDTDKLLVILRTTTENINNAIHSKITASLDENDSSDTEVDMMLEKLSECLFSYETERASEIVNEMMVRFASDKGTYSMLSDISKALADFDVAQASASLEILRSSTRGDVQ